VGCILFFSLPISSHSLAPTPSAAVRAILRTHFPSAAVRAAKLADLQRLLAWMGGVVVKWLGWLVEFYFSANHGYNSTKYSNKSSIYLAYLITTSCFWHLLIYCAM
jgi:hypothetical protein